MSLVCNLNTLPVELVDRILSFLSYVEDFQSIAATSENLNCIARNYVLLAFLKICSKKQQKRYLYKRKICSFTTMLKQLYLYRPRPPPLYVPLDFWFTKKLGLSLPLIKLEHNPIALDIELAN